MNQSPLRHRIFHALLSAVALFAIGATNANACSRDTDCEIGQRTYRIALPEGHDGATPIGAIVFAHGYRGTAKGVMRNKSLISLASDLGVALIALQAAGADWSLPGAPSADTKGDIDEMAYVDAMIADAAERFPIDRSRLMATGFSSGGMMVWNLACHRGSVFAGFAPMSGTFWSPVPETCPTGPVNMIHYHGNADPVVPLHGRPIKDAHQGEVKRAIEMMVRLGDYQPVKLEQTAGLECSEWHSVSGKTLQFCLFDGGHKMKAKHIARTWQTLVTPGD